MVVIRRSLLLLWSALLTGTPLAAGAAAPCYTMDAAGSSLSFVAEQTGAKFEGKFRKFDARISFKPADLAASRFDVMVDPASADTGEEQRDTTLRGPDFFDAAHFKMAHFVTTSFRKAGDTRYEATGKLSLRDVTRDVTIAFTFTTRKEGAVDVSYLAGGANLKRLDFGVGRGEYADTETIGNDVEIKFNLRLLPAAQAPDRKKIPAPPAPPQTR